MDLPGCENLLCLSICCFEKILTLPQCSVPPLADPAALRAVLGIKPFTRIFFCPSRVITRSWLTGLSPPRAAGESQQAVGGSVVFLWVFSVDVNTVREGVKLLCPTELAGLDLPAINTYAKSISVSQRETLTAGAKWMERG